MWSSSDCGCVSDYPRKERYCNGTHHDGLLFGYRNRFLLSGTGFETDPADSAARKSKRSFDRGITKGRRNWTDYRNCGIGVQRQRQRFFGKKPANSRKLRYFMAVNSAFYLTLRDNTTDFGGTMRKVILFITLMLTITIPVSALELEAPEVPDSGYSWMPEKTETFGQGVLEILSDVISHFRPDLSEAASVCAAIFATVLAISILQTIPAATSQVADLVGSILIAGILLRSTNSLINLGTTTIREISEYGKLLLPVMTAALAAQGGVAASGALYTGTLIFDTVLGSLITKVLAPTVYLFLAISVASSAIGEDWLKKLKDTQRSFMLWSLKTILYVFTGYITITGVVSGTTDAAALKAAKITISGAIPVVGGILSDASEAVLVSAGLVKSSVGIYGMLAIIAVWVHPFLKIGVHYLLLKGTGAICGILGSKRISDLVQDFSAAMGIVLAMTGTVCLMLMISTVCFMKGVG